MMGSDSELLLSGSLNSSSFSKNSNHVMKTNDEVCFEVAIQKLDQRVLKQDHSIMSLTFSHDEEDLPRITTTKRNYDIDITEALKNLQPIQFKTKF